MRNRRLLPALTAVLLCAVLFSGCLFPSDRVIHVETVPLAGPDGVTVESLFKNAQDKVNAADTVSMDMVIDLEMKMTLAKQETEISVMMDMTIDTQGENAHLKGTEAVNAAGVSQSLELEQYSGPGEKSGTYDMYANIGSGWTHTVVSAGDSSLTTDTTQLLADKIVSMMTLQPGTDRYEGQPCYVVKGTIPFKDLSGMGNLDSITQMFGGREIDMSAFVYNAVYYFSVEDQGMLGAEVEFAGAMADVLGTAVENAAGVRPDMEVPTALITFRMTGYNTATDVIVPESVRSQAVTAPQQ